MQTAGFVLAGGASSRMGTNKAFLRCGDRTLIEIAAEAVAEAAGSVAIIGQPELYASLGYPVIADRLTGAGPLAGIETALLHTTADWNLIAACDMPGLQAALFQKILAAALADPDADCVLPMPPGGRPEPLCAAYHKRALTGIATALASGVRKVTAGLAGCRVHYLSMRELGLLEPETPGDLVFQNVNTPEEWRAASVSRRD
jgi:molybdopterin-guanine dinucleotide biosynthesis protein A